MSLWVFMGPQRSLCVFMGPMGPFINPFTSFSILMSLCVLTDSNWSLWETVGPYAFLWFIMGLFVSLCVLFGF